MSSPPLDETQRQQVRIYSAYESFKHNASLVMLVVAPVLIAIPPRKLDLYTFSLAGAFVAATNQLTIERTGRGLIQQFSYERAPKYDRQENLLEEKVRVPDEILRRNAGSGTGHNESISEKAKEIWMGGETEGWKERRLKEEQVKLDNGEGYGGMIVDQIWEVWNWGEKKSEELVKKHKEVIEQRTQDKRS